MRELSTRQARLAKLPVARRAEAAGSWADAKRQYTALANADDTGPEALLGLARVLARSGDLSATDVARKAAMDKVKVSRAVRSLL